MNHQCIDTASWIHYTSLLNVSGHKKFGELGFNADTHFRLEHYTVNCKSSIEFRNEPIYTCKKNSGTH